MKKLVILTAMVVVVFYTLPIIAQECEETSKMAVPATTEELPVILYATKIYENCYFGEFRKTEHFLMAIPRFVDSEYGKIASSGWKRASFEEMYIAMARRMKIDPKEYLVLKIEELRDPLKPARIVWEFIIAEKELFREIVPQQDCGKEMKAVEEELLTVYKHRIYDKIRRSELFLKTVHRSYEIEYGKVAGVALKKMSYEEIFEKMMSERGENPQNHLILKIKKVIDPARPTRVTWDFLTIKKEYVSE